jgi:hypothetical protein
MTILTGKEKKHSVVSKVMQTPRQRAACVGGRPETCGRLDTPELPRVFVAARSELMKTEPTDLAAGIGRIAND